MRQAPAIIAAILSCVVSRPAVALPWSVEGHVAADTGYDSNVYRNFEGVADFPVVADGFLQAEGDLDLVGRLWSHQRTELTAQLGARLFALQSPEDTGVGQLGLTHAIGLSRKLVLSFDAGGKDKWVDNDDRAYADYGGGATLSIGPFLHTRLDLRAGYRAFNYFPDPDFSELGPAFSALLSASPWRKQDLFIGYRVYPQFYEGPRTFADGSTQGQRFDWYHVVTAGYAFHGPVVASLTYSFIDDRSDSFGESLVRHRVEGLLGAVLPWRLYLVVTGALQFTSYPDGLYLSPELLLQEDDDDLNDISVKISRDLGAGFSVEARYAYYRNDFVQQGLTYERQVAYLGVAYRH